jgi:hypothetical protein
LQARQHALAQALVAGFQFFGRATVLGIGAGNRQHQRDDHHEQQRQAGFEY